MEGLKKKLNGYLKKYVLPKIEKDGFTDISVYGIKQPSESIGYIFIDTEPEIRKVPNQRGRREKLIELFLQEEIEMGLSLLGVDFYDYNIQFNKRPLYMLDEEELPFNEMVTKNERIRTFSQNLDESELKWHTDEQDRIVVPLTDTDWKLQLDDELPLKLIKGKKYFIPEGKYHRVIKGQGNLKIKVIFK